MQPQRAGRLQLRRTEVVAPTRSHIFPINVWTKMVTYQERRKTPGFIRGDIRRTDQDAYNMQPFGVKWPRDGAESIQIQILSDCKTDRAIGEKFRLRSLRLELGSRDENKSLAGGQKAPQLSRDSPPAD